jgi:DeoR/GlpR family transcriptional regulator of sugar metabolism
MRLVRRGLDPVADICVVVESTIERDVRVYAKEELLSIVYYITRVILSSSSSQQHTHSRSY